jgi:copper chaperone
MCGTTNRELPLTARNSSGCACCAPTDSAPVPGEGLQIQAPAAQPAITAEYRVAGMTCGHCASSVTGELRAIEGVTDVQVALVPDGISTVTIAGNRPVAEAAIRAAVAEAGYRLAGS